MKYRFYGDTLQLVKYELSITHEADNINKTHTDTFTAVTEEEKADLLAHYPDAVVTEIDNTGYEWLDGTVWTQEQLQAGELDKAIAMGQAAYTEMINMPSQEEINAMLMLEIAKLKAGANHE